jgi:hypothetical protein
MSIIFYIFYFLFCYFFTFSATLFNLIFFIPPFVSPFVPSVSLPAFLRPSTLVGDEDSGGASRRRQHSLHW